MSDINSTVITIGSLVVLSNLALTWLQIKRLTAPKPINQELDKSITGLDIRVGEHERRITTIESSRVVCHQNHLTELDKLYRLCNATATSATATNEKLDLLIRLTRSHKQP
ncbi:MAG: hypothetical protein ACOYOU_08145 [Kiritimatiellia bacterium]